MVQPATKLSPAAETVPRRSQHRVLERRDRFEIDAVLRKKLRSRERLWQQAIFDEPFRAEYGRVPREGGVGLIGRVAEAGGTEWQNLPPGLLHRGERVDPAERDRSEITDAERPRQAGGVKQDSRRTFEHDEVFRERGRKRLSNSGLRVRG